MKTPANKTPLISQCCIYCFDFFKITTLVDCIIDECENMMLFAFVFGEVVINLTLTKSRIELKADCPEIV